MKTKLHILTLVLLGSILMGSAQTSSNLNDLLLRLNENHIGAVSDVFTPDEIATLRTHFNAQNAPLTAQFERSFAGEVFATENVNENFGHFQSSNPDTYDVLGPAGAADFEGAGAYDPFTGLFYIIDNVGNAYAVDFTTGIYLPLGTVSAPAGESFTGLEFDPSSGNLFAISTDGMGSSTLSTIDPTTGQVTVIGDTGLVLAIAIALDIAGAFIYAFDIDTDLAYRIDTVTAVATVLGPLGFDASFGQGMFLDPISGLIYLTAFNNTAFRSELRKLNTDTGATTLIGPIGSSSPGGTLQFAWASLNKSSLGVTENALANLKLFPNPASNALQLSSSEVIEEVFIYNMLGQQLGSYPINALDANIDVSAFKSGTYLVTININGQEISRPFIKQ